MARKKTLSSISLAQVAAFVGIILAGYFIIGFGKVALVGHQLRGTKAHLEAQVAALEQEVAGLEATKEFVQTDAYIEQAAREEYKMSRPGDQVIVPLFEDEAAPPQQKVAEPARPASPAPTEPWQAWWDLFFGE
ncbi:MAG: septum formation initiator family protein [Chloroflexi bacterium]|nr:MAG: septum formation initiator family protein [Chloroflexota bacterium]